MGEEEREKDREIEGARRMGEVKEETGGASGRRDT